MSAPHTLRVEVRGVVYDSVPDCAAALKVKPMTVYAATSLGRTANLGIGRGKHKSHVSAVSKQITILGVTYPSMRAASLALGMNDKYVFNAISKRGERGMQDVIARAMQVGLAGAAKQEKTAMKALDKRLCEGLDVRAINRGALT